MSEKKSDLRQELENLSRDPFAQPVKKRSYLKRIIFLLFLLCLFSGIFLSWKVLSAPEDVKEGGIFTQIKHLVTSSDKKLAGEAQNRINIVVLGIGGENHEGPLLADTIIVASIEPSTKKVAMISVPRDLVVPIPGYGSRKINHAYALPEADEEGAGGKVLSSVIENIFGIPVHYFFRIDFQGFVEVIDELGGITVNVDQKLEDPFYPIPGKESATTSLRYEHLVIEPGIRYMDGETALKYVRSRMAYGSEGSDFARSRRQQKVLLALKNKILAPANIFQLGKLNRIVSAMGEYIDTNLEAWEILRLYDMGKTVSSSNIITVVLDDGPKSVLYAVSNEEFYGLLPKKADWSDLHAIGRTVFDADQNIHAQTLVVQNSDPNANQAKEQAELEKQKKENQIEIHNGTKITGLAKKTEDFLKSKGYNIVSLANAPVQTYKKSLIYNLKPESSRKKNLLIKELESLFSAVVFNSGAPNGIISSQGEKTEYKINPKADILIILGEDWNANLSKSISND